MTFFLRRLTRGLAIDHKFGLKVMSTTRDDHCGKRDPVCDLSVGQLHHLLVHLFTLLHKEGFWHSHISEAMM